MQTEYHTSNTKSTWDCHEYTEVICIMGKEIGHRSLQPVDSRSLKASWNEGQSSVIPCLDFFHQELTVNFLEKNVKGMGYFRKRLSFQHP